MYWATRSHWRKRVLPRWIHSKQASWQTRWSRRRVREIYSRQIHCRAVKVHCQSHFVSCWPRQLLQECPALIRLHSSPQQGQVVKAHYWTFFSLLARSAEERHSAAATWTGTSPQEEKATEVTSIDWNDRNVDDGISNSLQWLTLKQYSYLNNWRPADDSENVSQSVFWQYCIINLIMSGPNNLKTTAADCAMIGLAWTLTTVADCIIVLPDLSINRDCQSSHNLCLNWQKLLFWYSLGYVQHDMKLRWNDLVTLVPKRNLK